VWEGGKLVEFEPGDRPEPEIYLAYFSAHWCGPCQRFTPGLIDAYRELKADPELADRFELVFISSDRDAREQLKYVRETAMPWTVLKYAQRGRARAVERWAGDGIPCLVALTPDGRLLFHSYRGEEYRGPEDPLQLVRELLRQMPGRLPATRLARHRLAIAQHELAAQGSRLQLRPYLIAIEPQPYRRAGVTTLTAVLSVDETGRVTAAQAEPQLPVVTAERFRQEAMRWLFLPQIEEGHAVPATVRLPLDF
jgi:thiol-disulfide isomerase/thioredoxin